MDMSTVVVTGAAGFIGYHLSKRLLSEGHTVIGIDNINDYYEVSLKHDRLTDISKHPRAEKHFSFFKEDICDLQALRDVTKDKGVSVIVNLAAQAGVRYSIENPQAYVDTNITGFLNILQLSKELNVEHLVYASSSSVYGSNSQIPFSTEHSVDHPVSIYAATKKSNELMAHVFSHMYGLPTTGLRFFTVYGPWGRPDMAPMLFSKAISKENPIKVFNYGEHHRDFTYIDDIVDGILGVIAKAPKADNVMAGAPMRPDCAAAPFRVYNIGAENPVHLMRFIEHIESNLGKKAVMEMLPMQPGDVERTFADVSALVKDTGYAPSVGVEEGVRRFVDWYKQYYGV
tara:strand:- start:4353 stop:5381 length:1029 start_codon:yes stop_codon:yes gene_type:complete